MNLEIVTQKASLTHDTHERLSDQGLLVYPVLSRRSRGISIGINLNPDKVCNFDCVYCQVDRRVTISVPEVSIETIIYQLEWFLIKIKKNDGLWEGKEVKDIAFSGDGEPSTYPKFYELLLQIIEVRNRLGFQRLKLILITNASCFHKISFLKVFPLFFQEGGQIWAKLDAGDDLSYRRLMKTTIPFQRILNNIQKVGQAYPIILQSCFMQLNQQPFQESFLGNYIKTVQNLIYQKTQIVAIQAYTIARPPAEKIVQAWDNETMDCIGSLLRSQLNLPVSVYYGC